MRRLLLCALLASTWSGAASAESVEARPSWTLQVDPLTTAIGLIHLQVEGVLSDHWSLYASPSLGVLDNYATSEEFPSGIGVEAGVRYFFSGTAPEGWWGQLRGVAAHGYEGDETAFVGYISGLGGYTAIFDRWFVLAGGLGVQYISYRVGDVGPRKVFPAAHTTVGVAF